MGEIKLVLPGASPTGSGLAATGTVLTKTSTTMNQLQKLTESEQKQVSDFAKQIDLRDSALIVSYGVAAQKKLGGLTKNALKGVSGQDTGEVGKLLAEMSVSIKSYNDEANDSKKPSFLRSVQKKAETLRVKYDSVTHTLERIAKELENQRMKLLADVNMLDDMYNKNLDYYKELTMYILAGRERLEEAENGELEELRKNAEMSGSQEDAFLYNDFRNMCDNFSHQLSDLEITRTVCLQTAPQIRLVQDTNTQLVRKIQSSINNTLPIWEQKLAIALALEHSRLAAEAQKSVTDLTGKMLEDTAKLLHLATTESAREAERGIIDIDAVIASNTELIAAIQDVLSIREEGCKARAEARVVLEKAEEELRQTLLGASQRQR